MCYQVCSRLGYWNTVLLGNCRRQCGAQASGLASLREGVGVFTCQLLSVWWLKAARGEQRKTLNSPALLAALCFSRADSGGRQSPQAELQEVRLGWHGRHQGRYWQHRLTQVTQTVYFRLAIEQFTVWTSASSEVIVQQLLFLFSVPPHSKISHRSCVQPLFHTFRHSSLLKTSLKDFNLFLFKIMSFLSHQKIFTTQIITMVWSLI